MFRAFWAWPQTLINGRRIHSWKMHGCLFWRWGETVHVSWTNMVPTMGVWMSSGETAAPVHCQWAVWLHPSSVSRLLIPLLWFFFFLFFRKEKRIYIPKSLFIIIIIAHWATCYISWIVWGIVLIPDQCKVTGHCESLFIIPLLLLWFLFVPLASKQAEYKFILGSF